MMKDVSNRLPEDDYFYEKRQLISDPDNSNIWIYMVPRKSDNKMVIIKRILLQTDSSHFDYRTDKQWLHEVNILIRVREF